MADALAFYVNFQPSANFGCNGVTRPYIAGIYLFNKGIIVTVWQRRLEGHVDRFTFIIRK